MYLKPIDTNPERWTVHRKWMSPGYEPGLASVIIPSFNRPHMLREAIESCIAQTYRPLEVIVADDGSSPPLRDLVSDTQRSSSDVRLVYVAQPNTGVQAARNLGCISCSGQYVQFLDSDDALHPQKLELSIEAIRAEKVLACIAESRKFKDRLPVFDRYVAPQYQVLPIRGAFHRFRWYTAAPLYSRDLLWALGPWAESVRDAQDWELSHRMLYFDVRVAHYEPPLAFYREHREDRISLQPNRSAKMLEAVEVAIARLNATDRRDTTWPAREIREFSYRVFRTALKEQDLKLAEHAAAHGSNLPVTTDFGYLKAKTAFLLRSIIGAERLNRLLVASSRLKSAIKTRKDR